jgi:hypothetical protein
MRIPAIAILAAVSCSAAPSAQDASQAADALYTSLRARPVSGLPDRAARNRLAPSLSAALRSGFARSQREQHRCNKAHPGEKGPWVEGDMFSSNFEGFTAFRIGETNPGANGSVRVTIEMEYQQNGQKTVWKDQVSMIRERGLWVLDDVLYGRTEGFNSGFGSSLRQSLASSGC